MQYYDPKWFLMETTIFTSFPSAIVKSIWKTLSHNQASNYLDFWMYEIISYSVVKNDYFLLIHDINVTSLTFVHQS